MKSFIVSTMTIIMTFVLFAGMETAYGQSDFYLEGKVNESPYGHNLNITKLEIQGNSSYYKEICPSLKCKIDYKDKSTSFSPPDIPDSTSISSHFDFTLHDDITHADLGPKKKLLVEEYGSWIYCNTVDIIEDNGQELYYCHEDGMSNIYNNFNHTTDWRMNVTGIYDAKNDILKVNGNFTKCVVLGCGY